MTNFEKLKMELVRKIENMTVEEFEKEFGDGYMISTCPAENGCRCEHQFGDVELEVCEKCTYNWLNKDEDKVLTCEVI